MGIHLMPPLYELVIAVPEVPPQPTNDCQSIADNNSGYCQHWNANAQTFQPDHTYNSKKIMLMLNQYQTIRRGPYIVKLTQPNGSCWAETVLASQTGYSTDLPAPGVKEWVEFTQLKALLLKDTLYRIVVHTTPGWEYWNGSAWVPGEQYATMKWWGKDTGNPYPIGQKCWGCNFQSLSGSWTYSVYGDRTFCVYE